MSSDGRSWRKLQRLERAQHRLWPVMARALRDHLLRLPDDSDGVIFESTKDPVGDLLQALGAHQSERKAIAEAIRFLLDDGYLVHSAGFLIIKNFEKEQTIEVDKKRSDAAERKRRQRERERLAKEDKPEQSRDEVTEPSVTVTEPVTGQSRAIREEKRREDYRVTRDRDGVTRDRSPQKHPDEKIPCPGDLKLTSDQRGSLEASMIPGWAIDVITTDFVAAAIADQSDIRQLVYWQKCLSRAVSGRWNDPKKRPKNPASVEFSTETAEQREIREMFVS